MDYMKKPLFNKIKDLDKFSLDVYEKRRSELAEIGKLKNKVKHENLFERVLFQKGVNMDKDISLSKKYIMVKEKLMPEEKMRDYRDVKYLLEESKTKDFCNWKHFTSSKYFSSSKMKESIEKLNLTKKFKYYKKKKISVNKDPWNQIMIKSYGNSSMQRNIDTNRSDSPVKIAKQRYKNISFKNSMLKNQPLMQIILLPKIENLKTDVSEKVEEKEVNKSKELNKHSFNTEEIADPITERKKNIIRRKTLLSNIFQAFEKTEDGQKYAEYLNLAKRRDSKIITIPDSITENIPTTLSIDNTIKISNTFSSNKIEREEILSNNLKISRNKFKETFKHESKASDEKSRFNDKTVSRTVNDNSFKSKQSFMKSNCKMFLENSRKINLSRVKNKLNDKYNQLNEVSKKINVAIKKALDVITKKEIQSEDRTPNSDI